MAGAAAVAVRAQSAALNPSTLEKFVDPLPIPPVAKSTGAQRRYRLEMTEFLGKVHRDLPPTRMWGYNGSSPGPVIEARSGQSVSVEWVNHLPKKHLFPIDYNLHGSEKDKPDVRSVVHVHGAKTQPENDGYPEDWVTPGKSIAYRYPNNQDAATLWYHDHAMGINRLNIYAGLFGLFLIRDAQEDALNLPKGRYEIPLVIYDRSFLQDGGLDYPVSGMPNMPWVPEAFGEAMMVNGKLTPYLEVEPRRYRFRILNAANGRFFHLSLSNGQQFFQIGSDQGLMPAPVALNDFVIAPGERLDVIVDFSASPGQRIVLKSDAFELMQSSAFRTSLFTPRYQFSLPRHAFVQSGQNSRVSSHQDPPYSLAGIQRPHGRFHDHAAGRQTLGYAGHREPDHRHSGDLGIHQYHRGLPSHPPASGALPTPRSPQLRRASLFPHPPDSLHRPSHAPRAL